MPREEEQEPVTLIVDGANVMGSRADGWWRDPAAAMARLHTELGSLAARGIAEPPPGGSREAPTGGIREPPPGGIGEPPPGSSREAPTGGIGEPSPGGSREPSLGGILEPSPGERTGPGAGEDPGRPAGGSEEAAGRWFPCIILVVEGRAARVAGLVAQAHGVRVVAARGAGDDEIASLAASVPGKRIVITADQELRRRSQRAGAAVAGPRWLTRQLA